MITQEYQIERLHKSAVAYHKKKLDAFGLAAINAAISTAGEANAPKAKAIQDWSRAIWSDYRARKEAVSAGTFNENYYFSNNGELPYGFYEAIDEAEAATTQ
jgi:hypothetical protein